ncbi:MAG TPA: hypothetical protein VH913_13405 [Hyphomicrobiaceae bacterium]|jgi:hypothetical protein
MANEPDNLVLLQLREIRATLAGHSSLMQERFAQIGERFAQMDRRFDQLDERFDDFHAVASHTLVLSTSTSMKQRELQHFNEGEQRRLRERVDELERRVTKVEEERDG